MPNLSKKNTTIIIVVACVGLLLGAKFIIESTRGGLTKKASARSKGNANAPIQIIKYIDFQCPACAQGTLYLRDLFGEHSDKLYVEVKNFPLGMHRHAFSSARYAQCAARQDLYWPFVYSMTEKQNQWKDLINAHPTFKKIAEEAGLNMTKLDVCLQDESVDKLIFDEKEEGNSLGIQSTPTYFINEKRIVGNRDLKKELKRLLEGE